jgi:hypothetical protein
MVASGSYLKALLMFDFPEILTHYKTRPLKTSSEISSRSNH